MLPPPLRRLSTPAKFRRLSGWQKETAIAPDSMMAVAILTIVPGTPHAAMRSTVTRLGTTTGSVLFRLTSTHFAARTCAVTIVATMAIRMIEVAESRGRSTAVRSIIGFNRFLSQDRHNGDPEQYQLKTPTS